MSKSAAATRSGAALTEVAPTMEFRNGIRFRSVVACTSCGGSALRLVRAKGEDFETGLGQFIIVECTTCGMHITDPQPEPDDIPLLYADREAHDFENAGRIVSQLRRLNNRRQLKRLPTRLRRSCNAALDYGCGSGFFTKTMREFLPGRIIGSDFHDAPPPTIAASREIEYIGDDAVDSLAGELDLVICRNVLEHTAKPIAFINRMRMLLRLRGVLLIEVPNRTSIWSKVFGRFYFNYYLPRHLQHYDHATLEKQLVGFRLLGSWYDHSPILGKSVGFALGRRISGFSASGLALLPIQVAVDRVFGSSSQLVVVAEKT